jgi:acyl dehydratase
LKQTHVLRGVGGFGSVGSAPSMLRRSEPAAAACEVVDIPTRPEQALLYRLNGDSNPIHIDPVTAESAGFRAPILHGMCTFGLLTRAVVEALCEDRPERLGALSMRFTGIVYPGETLRAHIFADGSFRASIAERNAVVVDLGSTVLASSNEKILSPSHAF